MKIAALAWSGNNIGDDVQSVAAMQHLPPVDTFIPRDHLNAYDGERALLVMNGWFLKETQNWPPSDRIVPLFFGFHVQKKARKIVAENVEYLKKHAPIGCRDKATTEFIRSLGVDAYFSYCATLTFNAPDDRNPEAIYMMEPHRQRYVGTPLNPDKRPICDVSHRFISVPNELRISYARELIKTYGRTASHVITSRIHCAMPCVAMGIPTLFTGPVGGRTGIIDEVGIPRHPKPTLIDKLKRNRTFSLPEKTDISELKKKITKDIRSRIEQRLAQG